MDGPRDVPKVTKMNSINHALRSSRVVVLLLGVAIALVAGACALAATPTPTPISTPEFAGVDQPTGKVGAGATPQQAPPGEGVSGGAVGIGGPTLVTDLSGRLEWIGQIVVSAGGIELERPCDDFAWALTFTSAEVKSAAEKLAGKKTVVWGALSPVSARRTIQVEAVYETGSPMPKIAVPEYPCPGDTREQVYSWVGMVVASELEGRHLELKRDCDFWVLKAESDEVARKLESFVGKKLTVWGNVATGPSINMLQTIAVQSAYGPDELVVMLYVPEYPCTGTVTPVPPGPVPVPSGIDLQAGELAAIGKLVRQGETSYLETPAGRILLQNYAGDIMVVPPVPLTPAQSPAAGGVAGAAPSYAGGEEVMVVGKWRIEGGQLIIAVRYTRSLGYTVPPKPVPSPGPLPPTPGPVGTAGVLYGQVKIGPLCPVEPCRDPIPDVYSSRSLLLESGAGKRTEVPLMPGGWFKLPVEAGTYGVTLSNCDFLGCRSALPQRITVVADQVTELTINIDTGIR